MLLREILVKMDPKLAPRGRGRSPRPLGAGFGSIFNRISFKNHPKTGPGSNIHSPEALLTNPEALLTNPEYYAANTTPTPRGKKPNPRYVKGSAPPKRAITPSA